jgi:hypothetical protein
LVFVRALASGEGVDRDLALGQRNRDRVLILVVNDSGLGGEAHRRNALTGIAVVDELERPQFCDLSAEPARRVVAGIGLFGTVWGIMNSFIGISQQHTTNLAVVAPGIAEALLATALGLAAAIPAVVIYNMFSRSIANYRALYADGTAAILRAASRDLDRTSPRMPVRGNTSLAAHRP